MALLQRTLATGSIWIGSGDPVSQWSNYNSDHTLPFAIYEDGSRLLDFTTSANLNRLTINTMSAVGSQIYKSGFTGQGFKVWANPKTFITETDPQTRLYWTGQFDDLWVRGSMHVKQFVIDKIRATNGSLWVSDAAKVISASYISQIGLSSKGDYSGTMSLYFQTNSTMPFWQGDIIRSKQWIPSGTTITSNWDFIGIVKQVGTTQIVDQTSNKTGQDAKIYYNTVSIRVARKGTPGVTPVTYSYHYYAGNDPQQGVPQFISNINQYGADFVRVGNINNSDRQGAIYLTSNDNGGPFMDIVNDVSTIGQALGGQAVTWTVTQTPGATAEQSFRLTAGENDTFIGKPPVTLSINIPNIDTESRLKMRIGNLQGINDSTFGGPLTGYGMWADNAYLRGWIVANQGGNIAGWKIEPNTLSNLSMKLVANTNTSYIGLGTDTYSGNGIWIGTSSAGSQFSLVNQSQHLKWDGDALSIQTPHFQLKPAGNIIATDATLSGSIKAESGWIDNWKITNSSLYSNNSSGGQVRLATSGSYIDIIDSLHDFNEDAYSSLRYNSISVYSEEGLAFTTSTGFQTTSMVRNDCPYTTYVGSAGVAVTQSYGTGWKAVVFMTHTNSVIFGGASIPPVPIWEGGGAF